MAYSQTLFGTVEQGGGLGVALPATTAQQIFPRAPNADGTGAAIMLCMERQSMRGVVNVVAKGTFNLNLKISPDGGTTWVTVSQIASTAVTIDGGTAAYLQAARMNTDVGWKYKIEVYNTSGVALDFVWDNRYVSDSG